MQAIFVRHGSAQPAGTGPDAQRELLEEGKRELAATAEALVKMGVRLQRVLSSPLVRAAQSAGVLAEVHDGAEVEVVEALAPPADARAVRRRLEEMAAEGLQAVALVGHTPSLEACIGLLVGGKEGLGLSLSKAGAACVEIPPADSADLPTGQAGAPELRWLMRREQLARLAGG